MFDYLTALLWMIFEKIMGWYDENIASHATLTNIFAVFAIAVYVIALLDYQDKMTRKEGFLSGLMMTLVITLFAPFSQLTVHYVISPSYFSNVISYSVSTQKMI